MSVLAASALANSINSDSNSETGCESSLSYDSSSCDISSSSSCHGTYLSSEASPRLCAKELESIEAQPCLPSINYFKSLEAQVIANAPAWLNFATRSETAKAFAESNGIVVKTVGAFGNGIAYPAVTLVPASPMFSMFRAQALNKGVYDAGTGSEAIYSFQIIHPTVGTYIMIQFIVPRSQLPLNNIAYKRKCLY